MEAKIFLASEQRTLDFAANIAKFVNPEMILFLQGDLGVGKTTFVRGFLQALGVSEKIKSPTYTLVESYHVKQQTIYHFDLYRLENPEELHLIGMDEYLSREAILLIEWPEKAADLLPAADLHLLFKIVENGREIVLKSATQRGHELLQKLK